MLPRVESKDDYWRRKARAQVEGDERRQPPDYRPVAMPANSATGFVTAFFAVVTGFALIWHIWWMVALGVFGAFVTMLVFAFRETEEIEIPAAEVSRVDRAYRAEVAR